VYLVAWDHIRNVIQTVPFFKELTDVLNDVGWGRGHFLGHAKVRDKKAEAGRGATSVLVPQLVLVQLCIDYRIG